MALDQEIDILDPSMALEQQMEIQPAPMMTIHQLIDIIYINNLVPYLDIGLVRTNPHDGCPHDGSLQAGPSVRPNPHDVSLHARPNMAIGSVGSDPHDVSP